MLQLEIPSIELYDSVAERFINTKPTHLSLEHSLISVSKWESRWRIPFLVKTPKTRGQSLDYIHCMTITQNVDPTIYLALPQPTIDLIANYIQASKTATTFPVDTTRSINRETVTSELIYYWMIHFNIPFECERWHLDRLLTLINVCNFKTKKPTKRSSKDLAAQRRLINEERKAKYNTSG